MTAKQIIGALLIASPFLGFFGWVSKEEGFLFFLKYIISFTALVLIFGVGAILLTGCTATRTIEVPVPVPCAKPKNIPAPHNYMADLNKQSAAPDFVKACLATTESCFNAYNACALYHGE